MNSGGRRVYTGWGRKSSGGGASCMREDPSSLGRWGRGGIYRGGNEKESSGEKRSCFFLYVGSGKRSVEWGEFIFHEGRKENLTNRKGGGRLSANVAKGIRHS